MTLWEQQLLEAIEELEKQQKQEEELPMRNIKEQKIFEYIATLYPMATPVTVTFSTVKKSALDTIHQTYQRIIGILMGLYVFSWLIYASSYESIIAFFLNEQKELVGFGVTFAIILFGLWGMMQKEIEQYLNKNSYKKMNINRDGIHLRQMDYVRQKYADIPASIPTVMSHYGLTEDELLQVLENGSGSYNEFLEKMNRKIELIRIQQNMSEEMSGRSQGDPLLHRPKATISTT